MNLLDKIGDKLGYKRCESCGGTMWRRGHGSFILYSSPYRHIPLSRDMQCDVTEYCNRCAPPAEKGRLYRVDCTNNRLVPANEEAYEFELGRAGKPCALYRRIEDVPEPDDFHESFGMKGQW